MSFSIQPYMMWDSKVMKLKELFIILKFSNIIFPPHLISFPTHLLLGPI